MHSVLPTCRAPLTINGKRRGFDFHSLSRDSNFLSMKISGLVRFMAIIYHIFPHIAIANYTFMSEYSANIHTFMREYLILQRTFMSDSAQGTTYCVILKNRAISLPKSSTPAGCLPENFNWGQSPLTKLKSFAGEVKPDSRQIAANTVECTPEV